MHAFASRSFTGKSPALVKTPASMQSHNYKISVSSHPTSTPFAASVLPDELVASFNSPAAAALFASMGGSGTTPMPNMPSELTTISNAQEANAVKDIQNERYNRLKEVADILKTRMAGRGITRESVEMLAHMQGFAALWDENLLQIAGEKFVDLEIEFDENERNVVQKTSLKLNLPDEEEGILQEAASRLLKTNLTVIPNEKVPWYELSDFSANLDYLSRLEHIDTSANCFKVLDNLYDTFQKIWIEEKKRMKWRHDTHHFCRSNVGEPQKDTNGRLEMNTRYWTKGQHFYGPEQQTHPQRTTESEADWTAKFLIETGRPSIAALQQWLADDPLTSTVTVEALFQDSSVDMPSWLDPLHSQTKASANGGILDVDQAASNPSDVLGIRFVCTLEPEVLLPANVITALNESSTMVEVQGEKIVSFLSYMNKTKDSKADLTPNQTWTKSCLTFTKSGAMREKSHACTLYISNELKAYPTSTFVFAHPSQYANALPYLRQYALVNTLLQSIIPKNNSTATNTQETSTTPSTPLTDRTQIKKRTNKPPVEDKISSLLKSRSLDPDNNNRTLPISIRLDPLSSPTKACKIELNIPLHHSYFPGSILANLNAKPFLVISFDILLNGIVDVQGIEGVETGKDEMEVMRKKLAKVVRMSEDLGVVVEWVLREVGL